MISDSTKKSWNSNSVDISSRITSCKDIEENESLTVLFDKVIAIDMAAHIRGIGSLQVFLNQANKYLKENGLIIFQVTTLTHSTNTRINDETMAWISFIDTYFASGFFITRLVDVLNIIETKGYKVNNVVDVGDSYSHTLHIWYNHVQNFRRNIRKTLGCETLALWEMYLSSTILRFSMGDVTSYFIICQKK